MENIISMMMMVSQRQGHHEQINKNKHETKKNLRVKIGPHIGRFSPTLSHNIDCFRRCSSF